MCVGHSNIGCFRYATVFKGALTVYISKIGSLERIGE